MSDFVICIVCLSPRDMDEKGLVEKCEYCGDEEYIRSDFYVPDGKPFYGYFEVNKKCQSKVFAQTNVVSLRSKK